MCKCCELIWKKCTESPPFGVLPSVTTQLKQILISFFRSYSNNWELVLIVHSVSFLSHLYYQSFCLCLPEGEETSFDALESSSHKLVHLTALRAKGPKKRPPSTVLLSSVCMLHGSPLGTSPLTPPPTSSCLAFVSCRTDCACCCARWYACCLRVMMCVCMYVW